MFYKNNNNIENKKLNFTISIGMAEIDATDSDSKPVLTHADYAVYQAKQDGRNKVIRQDQAKEPLNKSKNSLSRHSGPGLLTARTGSCQYPLSPLQGEGRMGVDYLLDAGRYGLRVLSRHFPHPVGRIHQHDGEET